MVSQKANEIFCEFGIIDIELFAPEPDLSK
jgi:hypothetical protein